MALLVNGEAQPLPQPPTVAGLVAALGLEGQRLAVERNGSIVPRGTWATAPVADGDRLEVVRAIGGG